MSATTAPAVPSPSRRRSGLREGKAAWVLALPFCLLFLVFTVWPVIQSLFMSFTDTRSRDLRTPFAVNPVGIDNFTRAFGDEKFLSAVGNTAYFVVIGVPADPRARARRRRGPRQGDPQVPRVLPARLLPADDHLGGGRRRGLEVHPADRRRAAQHLPRLVRRRRAELARERELVDALDHPAGRLAQLRHRHDHLPGRPAGRAGEPARGRGHRRRRVLEAVPVHHVPAAATHACCSSR